MLSISSLLTDPNPDDPLESDVAEEYLENRPLFIKNAKAWTEKHAKPKISKRKSDAGDDKGSGSKKARAGNDDDDDDVQVVEPKGAPATIDLTGSSSTPAAPATKAKIPCKYGPNCYRKNPQHLQDYSH